ncbi:hypothetical protein Micbo1qcDRAFT_217854 [Microdochium bolleyi]|uniref:Ricin B lectin domain-containing protein n=1 Tax=Microdochium bolleyi TaxID=196109 RepID=A0A136JFW6_9PEZI|nr:hypothetical protein Micbo1qcDRAFT_217854 [Microdochium bolleyi]
MRLALPLTVLVSTLSTALSKPQQIRGVTDPVYHFYLQAYPKDKTIAVLGPESGSEYFDVAATIQSANTTRFLNVGGDSTSYKALTFNSTATTKAWGLEGDTIITTQGSSWGRQLNYLVCKLDDKYWQLYLQTGSAAPSGRTCSNYKTIHLPCLC